MKVPEPRKLKSGSWFIQLRLNGVSIPVTAPTKTDCIKQAELIKAEYRNNKRSISKSEITVGTAIDEYIARMRASESISERSMTEYEQIRKNRFKALMDVKISDLTNDMLQKAVDDEKKKTTRKGGTISLKTVKSAYTLIASSIRDYNSELNTRVNYGKEQRTFIDLLEPEDILRAVYNTDVELPVLLAMWLSLSMEEIRGLTKSKSIRDGKLYIVETVVDTIARDEKGRPILNENGKPKRIALRKAGGKAEERPRAEHIPERIQYLIDQIDGDIIEPRSGHAVYMRFQKVLEKAGLPPMRFHYLRHVFATAANELGIPTAVSQEIGGWKTDTTMKRVYTHSFTQSRKDANAKLDEYYESMLEKIQNANENANENEKEQ